MNCQQAEKMIITAVYGTLNNEEELVLKEHLSQCRECTRRWEQTASLRKQDDRNSGIPLPDPDRSWGVIADRLSKRRRIRPYRHNWRWAPAAAALMIVFAAGFFFGRRLLIVPPASQVPLPLSLSEISLENYADFLQPVLVNFSNQDSAQNPKSLRRLERRIVSDLLNRTRLLKSFIPENGNPVLRELLQDLEFILTAMDNLEPGDRDTARNLAGLIRNNDVSLRLRQLIMTQSTL